MPIASLTAIEVLRAGAAPSTRRLRPAPCSPWPSRNRRASAAIASASMRRPAARSSPSAVQAGRRGPPRSTRSGPRVQLRPTTFRRMASPSPAPSPAGNCYWTRMGRRASTNCFSRPSAAPRKAFRCISAWRGIGRCAMSKLSRAGNTLFMPGGRPAPRGRSLRTDGARQHAGSAIAKAYGADAFYSGPVAADMAATLRGARRRTDGGGFRQQDAIRPSSSSRSHFNGVGSTSGSVRPTGQASSRSRFSASWKRSGDPPTHRLA